jgi:hypothetical protein
MKNTIVILIGVSLFFLGYPVVAQNVLPLPGHLETFVPGQNEKYLSASGNLNYGKWPVSKVLAIYKAITKTELIVASNVQDIHGIDLGMKEPLPSDEAARVIEQALLNQAGIVITHLGGKKASVTYNDKLELQETPLNSKEPAPVGPPDLAGRH